MAYRAEIEIGVKGANKLEQLQTRIDKLARKITDINDASVFDPIEPRLIQSIQNYSNALEVAAQNLKNVELGQEEERKAVQQYVQALGEANEARALQNRLITQQIAKQTAANRVVREGATGFSAEVFGPQVPGGTGRQGDPAFPSSPVGGRVERLIAIKKGDLEMERALLALERKSAEVLSKKVQLQQNLVEGTREVLELAARARQQQSFRAGASGSAIAGPLAGPGSLGFPVALPGLSEAESKGLRVAKEKLQIIKRTVQRRKELGGLAANLQRLDNRAKVAIADANRDQAKLNDLKKDQLTTEQLIRKEQVKRSIARKRAIVDNARAARRRGGEALGSGLIGGAFPLLFGQGSTAAVGGAAGGAAGGLLGGQFGFALSLVGTALGDAATKAEEFNKSLAGLNAAAINLGSGSLATAENIKALAVQLGVTNEEAVELVQAFSAFEDFANKQALTEIFGSDSAAFDRVAAANTELKLAEAIFESRSKIGNAETQRLLDQLKIGESAAVELALAESLAEAQARVTAERAKQVTLQDRIGAFAAEFLLGTGGLDVEAAGAERARKILEDFEAGRETRLQTFKQNLETTRALLNSVLSFKPEKGLSAAESGDSLEQSLKRQLARYEEIEPLARARAVIEADHQVTLERISKVKDELKRKDLEALAGKVKEARLNDLNATEAKKRADEEARRIKTFRQRLTAAESEGRILQASLSGREREQRLIEDIAEKTKGLSVTEAKTLGDRLRSNEVLRRQKEVMDELKTRVDEIGATIKNSFVDGIQAAIDGSKTLGQVLTNMLNQLGKQLIQMGANKLFGSATGGTGLLGLIGGAFGVGGGVASAIGGGSVGSAASFAGVPNSVLDSVIGKAKGGPVSKGRPYVVGEVGPELFVPNRSGTIVPNGALGGSANVTVNVDASGSSVEGDANQAAQLGKMLGAAVQAELVKQKRPGGLLA